MSKILVVAEKPSVARDIARVLGAKNFSSGSISNDTYIVTWAIGHLIQLATPEELDEKYTQWKREDLPILPEKMLMKTYPKTLKQYETVRDLMNSPDVSSLICATDSGREGELIFRLIYNFAGCTKPFQRLWISSMTDEAISDGFANLRPGSDYDNLYASAKCRSEADWLVGMNGSRAFTITYGPTLSVGRVQSPTLALIVRRELERRAFIPEAYWELTATFGKYKGVWFDPEAKEEPKRITAEKLERLKAFAETLKGKTGTVTSVEKKVEETKSPLLFDLTSLQRDANRAFGWPAAKTLRVAQNLYEKRKVITYPRTDSRFLSHDLTKTLKGRAAKLVNPDWDPFVKMALESDKKLGGRYINDAGVSDHHAIIPTGKTVDMKKWDPDEKALYDMVVRRFLAMFLPNEVAELVKAVTAVDGESFETTGKTVLDPGWTVVEAGFEEKKKKAEDSVLPPLAVGEEKKVTSAKLAEKKTQPPAPYTEASLLSAMEKAGANIEDEELRQEMKDCGLGTPATRAAIIERLIQIGYIRRKGKVISPTEKGITFISILPEPLTSAEMTGRWEQGLAKIGRGEMDPDAFMADIRDFVISIVNASDHKKDNVDFGETSSTGASAVKEVLGACPVCGQGVLENSKAFYCSQWRSGCRMTIWKNGVSKVGGPEIDAEGVKTLLADKALPCENGMIELSDKKPFALWRPLGEGGEYLDPVIPEEKPKKATSKAKPAAKTAAAKKRPR